MREFITYTSTFRLLGIGPKDHLGKLEIPVIKDLPVGKKMYDHLTFIGLLFTFNQSIELKQEEAVKSSAFMNFLEGKGIATSLGGVEAFTYIKTKESKEKKKKYPDVELIFVGGGMHTDRGVIYRKTFGITDEIYDTVYKPLEDKNAISVLPLLVHPKSYGHVELKSNSPIDDPKLYGNFFTDPENHDIKTFIAAIREAQRIMKFPSMQKYNATLHSIPIPGCEKLEFDSDDYWDCALRHISPTLHHQTSTCKMGPGNDPEAIVDHRLKVYGIKNLRVADCSVIPKPVTAHTNAPSIMIGEKASDMIKEQWNMQK